MPMAGQCDEAEHDDEDGGPDGRARPVDHRYRPGYGGHRVQLGVGPHQGRHLAGDHVAQHAAADPGHDAEHGRGQEAQAVRQGFEGSADAEDTEADGVEHEDDDLPPEIEAVLAGLDFDDLSERTGKGLVAVERFIGRGITEDDLTRIETEKLGYRVAD
ncbi:hypothetical protein M1L60_31525 [Actinoplanes sp. TRM 88003]|uniref:Uncharacterized protein n=1 Tax=Paractinoplanes aksuensis TaxID=2939490 RepID=A0ABT1DW78_9ACTN|nr:hypothetical protein [Actinoplanes aksuensis]MCO8275120.1 hypothetical protein [Actinoplanes aksuensis]